MVNSCLFDGYLRMHADKSLANLSNIRHVSQNEKGGNQRLSPRCLHRRHVLHWHMLTGLLDWIRHDPIETTVHLRKPQHTCLCGGPVFGRTYHQHLWLVKSDRLHAQSAAHCSKHHSHHKTTNHIRMQF